MQNSQISLELRARVALEKHFFQPTYALGQNFILDEAYLDMLLELAQIAADDRVLEIGPGPGLMTALIARRAKQVLAVEMDEKLRPVLEDVLDGQDNAEIVFADAMKADLSALICEKLGGEGVRVIANLPYYITADLIQKMVLTRPMPESLCLMVQKEAAQRLMSRPGQKNWCAFAALVRIYGDCEVLEDVPPQRFNPPPHVDSCFVRLNLHPQTLVPEDMEDALLKMTRCCFHMRRKTLLNNMKAYLNVSQQMGLEILEEAGLLPQVRGETLELEEIAALTQTYMRHVNR